MVRQIPRLVKSVQVNGSTSIRRRVKQQRMPDDHKLCRQLQLRQAGIAACWTLKVTSADL